MPFSGLGMTPGGSADRQPGRDGASGAVLQIDGDQRLGARVDDIQLPSVDENALRTIQFGNHGVDAGSGELDDPAGARFRDQPAAVGSDRHANRIIQA